LTSVFEELDEDDVKECEKLAMEWNTKQLPDDIQRKYALFPMAQNIASNMPRFAKTIPTDVTDFLKFINHRTGAAFIAFAAYTNEDGQQTYAR
jgi:hypothetical protein